MNKKIGRKNVSKAKTKLTDHQKHILEIMSSTSSHWELMEKILDWMELEPRGSHIPILTDLLSLITLPCFCGNSDKILKAEEVRALKVNSFLAGRNYSSWDEDMLKELSHKLNPSLKDKASFIYDYAKRLQKDGLSNEKIAFIVMNAIQKNESFFEPSLEDFGFSTSQLKIPKGQVEREIAKLSLKFPLELAGAEAIFCYGEIYEITKCLLELTGTMESKDATTLLNWFAIRNHEAGQDYAESQRSVEQVSLSIIDATAKPKPDDGH